MRTNFSFTLAFALAIGGIACSNDPGTTRQQAAKTTEELKQQSREAAGNIKKGAAVAQTQITAAAQGVKEGLSNKKTVDLNKASKDALASLPGITSQQADRIIAERPYASSHQLVTRSILSEDEYSQIQDRVVVSR